MVDPILVTAAVWVVGRLRADVETGAWGWLKGWVRDDPLTKALEKVTQSALEETARFWLQRQQLDEPGVKRVVEVLDQLWPATDVHEGAGDRFTDRVRDLVREAMRQAAAQVEDLDGEFDSVSSLALLEEEFGFVVDPVGFAEEFTSRWVKTVVEAGVTNEVLQPLANQLNHEWGHATGEALLDGQQRLEHRLDDLAPTRVSEPKFPQFVAPDRVPGFVGRAEELEQLEAILRGGGATVVGQVAVGLGGVGKTALVTELCHRQKASVEVVRWLVADDRGRAVSGYLEMGAGLGLDLSGLGEQDAIARVRRWFESTQRSWLLVFDNVETPGDLDGLIPQSGPGRVVITSRFRDWARPDVDVVRVGVLPLEDAVALLTTWASRPPDVEAEILVEELGGLALAIKAAGAFCKETGWSYAQYRKHLQQRSKELLARNPAALQQLSEEGEGVTVLSVWDTSLERARAEAPGAQAVLDVLAYLGSDNIPQALLIAPIADEEEALQGGDELYVDEGLGALARYSLIDTHQDPDTGETLTVSVHRLVQEITRLSHTNDDLSALVVRLLRRAFPADPTVPGAWLLCDWLGPHVTAVAHHAEANDHEDNSEVLSAVAWLLDRHGVYLQHSGIPIIAPARFERALYICTRTPETDNQRLLTIQGNLANSYRSAGRTNEAIKLGEQVLATSVRILGDEHPNTLIIRGNLANSYRSAGHTNKAIELEKHVLATSVRILGNEHPNTLRARGNLATSYSSAGRTNDAIELLEQVLATSVRILGNEHPVTLTTRGNLATAYWSADRTNEAIELQEHVLATSVRILGNEHPNTLRARGNLASSYWSAGRTNEAIELQEQVLADRVRILGNEHPVTLTTRGNLATAYWSAGRTNGAIELLEQVLATSVRILGNEHPETVAARQVLAHWKEGRDT